MSEKSFQRKKDRIVVFIKIEHSGMNIEARQLQNNVVPDKADATQWYSILGNDKIIMSESNNEFRYVDFSNLST
jgi:hypothetical protein